MTLAATVLRVTYEAPQDPFVTSSQIQAPKRRPRLWLVALLAVPLSAAVIASGVLISKALKSPDTAAIATEPAAETSFAPQPFSIRGFMTLELGQFAWLSSTDTCSGWKNYDDIRTGTAVVVTDPSGKTIALGQLDAGIPRHDPDNTARVTQCRFPIRVAGVPGGHPFYGIEIAKRGKLDYARDKIDKPLELTLG